MNEDVIDIGDEVICVDSTIPTDWINAVLKNFPSWIKSRKKYIVRDIVFNDDISTGILLEGVVNPPIWIPLLKRTQEPAFAIWRFAKNRTAYMIQEEKESEGVDVISTEIGEYEK